jgi:hypothetical protein
MGSICQRLCPAIVKNSAKRRASGPRSPMPKREGSEVRCRSTPLVRCMEPPWALQVVACAPFGAMLHATGVQRKGRARPGKIPLARKVQDFRPGSPPQGLKEADMPKQADSRCANRCSRPWAGPGQPHELDTRTSPFPQPGSRWCARPRPRAAPPQRHGGRGPGPAPWPCSWTTCSGTRPQAGSSSARTFGQKRSPAHPGRLLGHQAPLGLVQQGLPQLPSTDTAGSGLLSEGLAAVRRRRPRPMGTPESSSIRAR